MLEENDVFKINSISKVPRQESPELVFLSSHPWLLLLRPEEDETGRVSSVASKCMGKNISELYDEPTILILSRVMHPFLSGSNKENCPLR